MQGHTTDIPVVDPIEGVDVVGIGVVEWEVISITNVEKINIYIEI